MKILYLDNDVENESAITKKAAADGEIVAADGLTGLTHRLAATDGGSAIHATLSVSAVERSGAPGVYYSTFQGDDLRLRLAVNDIDGNPIYIGKTIWLVFGDGTNILTSEPHLVVERRRPE